MKRKDILSLMNEILSRQGKKIVSDESMELRAVGFRSLDFSELALRVEAKLGKELNFDAVKLREIRNVRDVIDFFIQF